MKTIWESHDIDRGRTVYVDGGNYEWTILLVTDSDYPKFASEQKFALANLNGGHIFYIGTASEVADYLTEQGASPIRDS